jgi:alanine transaminase
VEDLAARVAAGEKLYVHCWGGRGRAGTVGSCLIAHMYKWVAATAPRPPAPSLPAAAPCAACRASAAAHLLTSRPPPLPLRSLGAEEALQRVQLAFDTRLDGGRPSPETDEQVAFVRGFVAARDASRQ